MLNSIIKFLTSMRLHIVMVVIVLGIVPMFVVEKNVVDAYRQAVINDHIVNIQSHIGKLAKQIGQDKVYLDNKTNVGRIELEVFSDIFNGRVLVVNSHMQIIYDSYAFGDGKILISEAVVNGLSGKAAPEFSEDVDVLEIVEPICDTRGNIIGLIMVDVRKSDFLTGIAGASKNLYVLQTILIILIVVIALFSANALIKPVTAITESIRKYSEGYPATVPETAYSETKALSAAFNRLFGRMNKLDESRQEFVSNVSHELKTPLTSIKVLADSLNGQEDVPVEIYKDFMSDITAEVDRENKIINDLLALVKLDKTASALNLEQVNINNLVENALKRLSPIAMKDNIEITFESFRQVKADVDEVKLSLAVTNLVENAIKYNRKDGFVKVSLNADHKNFYIQVEDSGIGIPKEHQDKIFERFYRIDKTRSRATGGTGLGLAITKDTVMMHNGSIRLESDEKSGTKFIMRIPLNHGGGGM